MSKEDIYDLLQGRPLTKENLYALQKDPRASGMSAKYDAHYSMTVENALREINKPADVRIPKSESRALNMSAGDEITFENICHWKKDPRYHDPNFRNPEYVKAVNLAVQEYGQAKDRQMAAEAEKDRPTLLK
ncbi:MAG: hypothetical protein NTV82_02815 [Candidatus Aminicenantes bacterium]|nr:hypothetical protein [Candidatus Aminicenantes bacterium]